METAWYSCLELQSRMKLKNHPGLNSRYCHLLDFSMKPWFWKAMILVGIRHIRDLMIKMMLRRHGSDPLIVTMATLIQESLDQYQQRASRLLYLILKAVTMVISSWFEVCISFFYHRNKIAWIFNYLTFITAAASLQHVFLLKKDESFNVNI